MTTEFLAQKLNSRQLLALLYVCESKRKARPSDPTQFTVECHEDWEEMLDTFAGRLSHLSEQLRFEVIEAHLMSVEDIDVYDNGALKKLLEDNQHAIRALTDQLTQDPRFC